jgi:hypothetical protein
MKLERAVPQQLLLLQLEEEEPDEDKDEEDEDEDDEVQSTVLAFGITIRAFEFVAHLLELFEFVLALLLLLWLVLIRGESSMNASVFFRSSNAIW